MLATSLHPGLAAPEVKPRQAAATARTGWAETIKIDMEGWKVFADVQLISGPHKEEGDRALAMLRNHLQRIAILVKEYFAEATEAYFYRNDFYPFVRAELQRHDPAGHALLEEIWGKID